MLAALVGCSVPVLALLGIHTSGEAASTIAATFGVSRATVYRALAAQS